MINLSYPGYQFLLIIINLLCHIICIQLIKCKTTIYSCHVKNNGKFFSPHQTLYHSNKSKVQIGLVRFPTSPDLRSKDLTVAMASAFGSGYLLGNQPYRKAIPKVPRGYSHLTIPLFLQTTRQVPHSRHPA